MKEDMTVMCRNRLIKHLCAYSLEKETREGKSDGDAAPLEVSGTQ